MGTWNRRVASSPADVRRCVRPRPIFVVLGGLALLLVSTTAEMPSPRGQQYLGEELDDAESQVAKSLAKEADGALEAAGDSADVPEDPLHVDAPVDSQVTGPLVLHGGAAFYGMIQRRTLIRSHAGTPVAQPKEVADEEEGDPDAIPLAEKLIENGQEHGEEADVEFGNQRVNYRFQRMSKAFEQQHEKIDRLVRLRIKNVNQSSIDEDEKVAKIEALNIVRFA